MVANDRLCVDPSGVPIPRRLLPCSANAFPRSPNPGVPWFHASALPESKDAFAIQEIKPFRACAEAPKLQTPPQFNEKTPREARMELKFQARKRKTKGGILSGPGKGGERAVLGSAVQDPEISHARTAHSGSRIGRI